MATPGENPTRRWPRILLAASLALNLLIVGLVAGAFLSGGPGARDRQARLPLQDLGLGPFVTALPPKDRAALVAAVEQQAGAFRENRTQMRAMFQSFLTAMRADPFDAAELRRIVDDQQAKISERQQLGRELWLDRIEAMNATERVEYADALGKALRRGPGRDGRRRDRD